MIRNCNLFLPVIVLLLSSNALQPSSFGQELLQSDDSQPMFELSNIRTEKGLYGDVIAFDYKRTRAGDDASGVTLEGRSEGGPVEFIDGVNRQKIEESGTIRLRGFSRLGGDTGTEFYFVKYAKIHGLSDTKKILVSNSVKHGVFNKTVTARALNANELAEIERQKKLNQRPEPPKSAPEGHALTTLETHLVPGVPVQLWIGGEWIPAKFVRKEKLQNLFYIEGTKQLIFGNLKGWVALSSETAKAIEINPSQFSISIRTLRGGTAILEDGYGPPAKLADLPEGIALIMDQNGIWKTGRLIQLAGSKVEVLVEEYGQVSLKLVESDKIAVKATDVEQAGKPEFKEELAKSLKELKSKISGGMTSNGLESNSATGLGLSSKSIDSSRAPFPDETTTGMNNTSAEPTKAAAEPSPIVSENPMRTWVDKSGKFKVKAKLVEQTDTEVVLTPENGKPIRIPITKLSASDQKELKREKGSSKVAADSKEKGASVVPDGPATVEDIDYHSPMTPIANFPDITWGAESVAISPDNRLLLIGRSDQSAQLIEINTGKTIIKSGRMDHMGRITSCGFTPDGLHMLIAGEKGIVEVYGLNEKGKSELKKQFAGHTKGVTCLEFSADGKFAMTGGEDNMASYWEVATGKQIASLTGFKGKVKAVRIRPCDGMLMATDGAELQCFDSRENKLVNTIKLTDSWASGQCAAFSPNGLLLAVADSYDLRMWNLQLNQEMATIKGSEIAWTAVFSSDNRHVFTGNSSVVCVWDAKTSSRVMAQPVKDNGYIQALGVNTKGTMIAVPTGFNSVGVFQFKGIIK